MSTTSVPDKLKQRLRQGAVLVAAVPKAGPHANALIVSVISRAELESMIREISKRPNRSIARAVKGIKATIRTGLANPLPPNSNPELLADLALMFAVRFTLGEKELDRSGLSSISLWIDEDESLEWSDRGMLDPLLLKEFGVSDRASSLAAGVAAPPSIH